MAEDEIKPRYLSPKLAAEYLGISPTTLGRLRIEGGGPIYSKAVRRVIYDPDDLDAWVKQNKRRFTGEHNDK